MIARIGAWAGLAAMAAAASASALPGLVASWTFDEGDGRTAGDLLGNLPAEFSGDPQWETDTPPVPENRSCLRFSPDRRDFLRAPGDGMPTPADDFTVEAWIRPESDPPTWLRVVACIRDGTGFQLCYGYRGNIVFAVWRAGERVQVRNAGHPLNRWTHVAGVWEAATGTARLFVDGEEVLDNAAGSALGVDTGGDVLIGTRGDDQGYFEGCIDLIRIWNYARTGPHIRAYFDRTMSADPQG